MKKLLYIIAVLLFLAGNLSAQVVDPDEPISKTYRLMYKTAKDFETLAQSLLSPRGELELSEDLNVLVVIDRPLNISRVDSLIHYYDLPAKQLMVEVQLLEGSNDPAAMATADSAEIHMMLDSLYNFETYEELDKVFIRVEEKLASTFFLAAGKYNISFYTDYVYGAANSIRFREFTLNEVLQGISGKVNTPIYTSSAEIPENTRQLFAAIKLERTGKTILVIVTAFVI